jgi:uncharacterized membrane protein
LVSPVILTAVISAIYLAVQLLRGVSLTEGMKELQRISQSVNPYIPYLIIVPMFIGILALVIKKKSNPNI